MATRTMSIHLDRFERGLSKVGVSLKRSQMLEVAASAFGFQSSNEMTALAQRGELDPPKARAIELSAFRDSPRMVTLLDPVVGRNYSMESSELEGRASWFGVTPYGNLVDLREALRPARAGVAYDPPSKDEIVLGAVRLAASAGMGPFDDDILSEAVSLAADPSALECLEMEVGDLGQLPRVTDTFAIAIRLREWREKWPPHAVFDALQETFHRLVHDMARDGISECFIEANAVVGKVTDRRTGKILRLYQTRHAKGLVMTGFNCADASESAYKINQVQKSCISSPRFLPEDVLRARLVSGPLEDGVYMSIRLESATGNESHMINRILDGLNKVSFFTWDGVAVRGPDIEWRDARNWCVIRAYVGESAVHDGVPDAETFAAARRGKVEDLEGEMSVERTAKGDRVTFFLPLGYLAPHPFQDWEKRLRDLLG